MVPVEVVRLGHARALVLSTPRQEIAAQALAKAWGDRAASVFAGATMHAPVEMTLAPHHKLAQLLRGSFSLTHTETHAILMPNTTANNDLAIAQGARIRIGRASSQSGLIVALANWLVLDDAINLMIVVFTPKTTNPVATTFEAEGMSVIFTKAPFQPRFIGQQGKPGASAR